MTVKTKVVRAGLRPVLLAALVAVLATIVDPANAIAATGRISVESGGLARTALLIQHRRLKQGRRPLVVVLRGGRERALRPRRLFGLEELARSSGPILLYPDPLGGRWSDSAGAEMTRDSAFIRDLIGKLVTDGLVDRRKVFMIGISNGGVMALRLACEHANLFAGVAAVLASLPADVGAACKPSRPLPFILIAGTADPLVSFNGGRAGLPDNKAELLSIEATLGVFGKAAGCGEGRTTTAFPDRNPNDGSRAYLDRLNGCKAPVALVRIEGGGHAVPGRGSPGDPEPTRPMRNNDIESAKVIWDFFRQAEN